MWFQQRRTILACVFLMAGTPGVVSADQPGPARRGPVITVETVYPGANAEVLADTVAGPLEHQVNGLENLLRLRSHCSADGRYTLFVHFAAGVDPTVAQVLVQARVNLACPVLPEPVQRRGLRVNLQSPGVLLFVILYSTDRSRDIHYLGRYASLQLQDELSRVSGVGDVSRFGGDEDGVRIWLDPDRLSAFNLTAAEVVRSLREQNVQLAAEQSGPGASVPLAAQGRLADPEDLDPLVLRTDAQGRVVRLRDVARVELGLGPVRGETRLDGLPVVALAISPTPRARPQDVRAAVQRRMGRLKQAFPPGIDHTLAFNLAGGAGAKPPGCLLVEPVLAPGVSAERTQELLNRYEKTLVETVGVQHVLSLAENPFAPQRGGPCVAVLLSPDLERAAWERELGALRGRLAKLGAAPRLRELAGPAGLGSEGYPVDLAVRGPDAPRVREFGERLAERLEQTEKLTDLAAGPGEAPQLVVDIDRAKAAQLGVPVGDIAAALQAYSGSPTVRDMTRFGRTWQVRVQVEDRTPDRLTALQRLRVRNSRGQMVPLGSLAAVREVVAPRSISRLDFQPMTEIGANPAPGVSRAEARWLCETLAREVSEELRLGADYQLVWLGDLPAPQPLAGPLKKAGPDAPPELAVSPPVVRMVTDYAEFVGRTQAVQTAELRPRVTGTLETVAFRDGAAVQNGDLLFTIDPRPFQAALDAAEADLKLAQADLLLQQQNVTRARKLFDRRAISREEYHLAVATVDRAKAAVQAREAARARARLDLDWTQVRCPFNGRIGRRLVDPGNVVKLDDTLLATVVSLDPIYVVFPIDERTLLRLERFVRGGRAGDVEPPAFVGLVSDVGYPRRGVVNFVSNRVDPDSGTLTVRVVLANRDEQLRPGMFARVRLPLGAPRKALLIPDEAIQNDLGQATVFVVNDQDRVVSRHVEVGSLHDGLRVIEKGLQADERVVVETRKRVREGMTVKPVRVEPPSKGPTPPG
jgi:RND family efflux transporter MFP subunit